MTTSIKPYKPCGITLVFSGVLACFTTSFNIFLSNWELYFIKTP
jgi:hypothetical protein